MDKAIPAVNNTNVVIASDGRRRRYMRKDETRQTTAVVEPEPQPEPVVTPDVDEDEDE